MPTLFPTPLPTAIPSLRPSPAPGDPTLSPTQSPTLIPTSPSQYPTSYPTRAPTLAPTRAPTVRPSLRPTWTPTFVPSPEPTTEPTYAEIYKSKFNTSASQAVNGITASQFLASSRNTEAFQKTVVSFLAANSTIVEITDVSDVYANGTTATEIHVQAFDPRKLVVQSCIIVNYTLRMDVTTNFQTSANRSLFMKSVNQIQSNITQLLSQSVVKGIFAKVLKNQTKILNGTLPTTLTLPSAPVLFAPAVTVVAVISHPTPQPTKALSISSSVSAVPSISRVRVYAGVDEAVVVVYLQDVFNSGNIYCAVSASDDPNQAINNTAQIRQAGYSVAYNFGDLYDQVKISGLKPLTSYTVLCFAQTLDGQSSAWGSVQNKKTSFGTLCCKSVTYSLGNPSSVYGDISKYVGLPSSYYLFTFSLSASPLRSIQVFLSTSSPSVVCNPNSFRLTAGGVKTGSYYITSSGNVANASIYMRVDDGDAEYYAPPVLQVTILSVSTPPPPPQLSQVFFDDSGNLAYIAFDSATNKAGFSGVLYGLCSDLFVFRGATNTYCTWTNATSITIGFIPFSFLPQLFPGDSVTLKGGIIAASCASSDCSEYGTSSQQTVTAQTATSPVKPSLVVNVAPKVTTCDDLVVDPSGSSGNGGRAWKYVRWTVQDTQNSNNTAILQQFLNKLGNSTSQRILVPSSLLEITRYFIYLTVTNYLGASSASLSSVRVVADAYTPTVSILGAKSLVTTAGDTFKLSGYAAFPSCAVISVQLNYNWLVFREGILTTLSSASKDRRVLLLPPYSLNTGLSYTLLLNVSTVATANIPKSIVYTTASLFVRRSAVVASVVGGYVKSSPIDRALLLDASTSRDLDIEPSLNQALSYEWSCRIGSFGPNYLQPCFLFSQISYSNVTIPANTMDTNSTYLITVAINSHDGRSDSQTVSLTPSPPGSAQVVVTASATRINYDSKIALSGIITAGFAVRATWQVLDPDLQYADISKFNLTVISTDFSLAQVAKGIRFPLVLAGSNLPPRVVYSFRLLACSRKDAQLCTFGQVSPVITSTPYGGTVKGVPAKGLALNTSFTLEAINWIDDTANYPLLYSFSYQSAPSLTFLAVSFLNAQASVVTKLPAGVSTNDYKVLLVTVVSNAFNVTSTASSTVVVTAAPHIDLSNVLTGGFSSYAATGDINSLFQVANAVATTLNVVNCTSSPDCAERNRSPCIDSANTCGNCLTGYTGVYGSSNSPCLNSSVGAVGSRCIISTDCVYSYCSEGICAVPDKACPTNAPSTICSGNGECIFVDVSGAFLSQCAINNPYCKAVCQCISGFYSSDCSLNSISYANAESARADMCKNLYEAALQQDKSPQLMDSVAASLLQSFSNADSASQATKQACGTFLSYLSTLASEGYLTGTKQSTQNTILTTISNFVSSTPQRSQQSSSSTASAISLAMIQSMEESSSTSSSIAFSSLNAMSTSILNSVSGGETPAIFVTSNARISMQKPLLSALANGSLTPPTTAEEQAYGVIPPKVDLPGSGLSGCKFGGGGYGTVSVMQWGANPHANSSFLKSGILQLTTYSENEVKSSSRRLLDAVEMPLAFQPLYFVTLQFSSPLKLNVTALEKGTNPSNVTIPGCTYYDSNAGRYVPCMGCNISTYTASNVTFGCHDLSAICSKKAYSSLNLFARLDSRQRALESSTSNDDSGGESSSTIAGYGALFESVGAEIASVLSSNPFANLAHATAILVFVSFLIASIFGGILWCNKLDLQDKIRHGYLHRSVKLLSDKTADRQKLSSMIKQSFTSSLSRFKPYRPDPLLMKRKEDFANEEDVMNDLEVQDDKLSSSKNRYSVIDDFLETVISKQSVLQEGFFMWRIVYSVLCFHPLTCMFTSAPADLNRLMRWLTLCRGLLINLFVDTLFFGIFYPDTGICDLYTTKATCLATPSKVSSETPMCVWDPTLQTADTECSLAPPPNDPVFTIILVVLTLILSIPFDIVIGIVMDIYGNRDPLFAEEKKREDKKVIGAGDEAETEDEKSPIAPFVEEEEDDDGKAIGDLERNRIADFGYNHFLRPEDEARDLLARVRTFSYVDVEAGRASETDPRTMATFRAIRDILRALPTGEAMPLTLMQRLTHKRPLDYLVSKIRRVKKRSADIFERIQNQENVVYKDYLLLQYFIVERMNAFKRYALSKYFFAYEVRREKINWIYYIIAWTFVAGSMAFFVYWIFAWGVQNGGVTLTSWGMNFGIGVAVDLFLTQLFGIVIIYALSIETMRPQLKAIYRTFTNALMTYESKRDYINSADHFRVVQHVCSACRTANNLEIRDLPAAKLLRCLTDYDLMLCLPSRNYYRGSYIVFLLIVVPGAIAVFSSALADLSIGNLIQYICGSFVLANAVIYSVNPVLLVFMYAAVVGFLLLRFGGFNAIVSYVRQQNRGGKSPQALGDSRSFFLWRRPQRNSTLRGYPLLWNNFCMKMWQIFAFVVTTAERLMYRGVDLERRYPHEARRPLGDQQQWRMMNLPNKGMTLKYNERNANVALQSTFRGISIFDSLPVEVKMMWGVRSSAVDSVRDDTLGRSNAETSTFLVNKFRYESKKTLVESNVRRRLSRMLSSGLASQGRCTWQPINVKSLRQTSFRQPSTADDDFMNGFLGTYIGAMHSREVDKTRDDDDDDVDLASEGGDDVPGKKRRSGKSRISAMLVLRGVVFALTKGKRRMV